jgi:hypothetical protein
MKKLIILTLVVGSILSVGCGKKEETPVEPAATSSTPGGATPDPVQAATPQGDVNSGTGQAGIRDVPPTQEGDRG